MLLFQLVSKIKLVLLSILRADTSNQISAFSNSQMQPKKLHVVLKQGTTAVRRDELYSSYVSPILRG